MESRARLDEHILVATGSWPVLPPLPGIEHAITSNEAFALERLPRRAIVVGAGYIALEFASIFHGLGVETDAHLPRQAAAARLRRRGRHAHRRGAGQQGRRICFGCEPAAIRKKRTSKSNSPTAACATPTVMFATGRRPNTAQLGLESAGVARRRWRGGGRCVPASSVPSIHAVGDVTNRINLTPVATAEAMWLARTLFRGEPTAVDHENVPTAVFANPNLATVGLSEESARAPWRGRHLQGLVPRSSSP